MVTFLSLVIIGFIAGIILALIMKIICTNTGNKADVLLYNMDYMPVLKKWSDRWITGVVFHYVTCIASVVVLFYILNFFNLEVHIWPYIFVFTIGGGCLYFLSTLTSTPPAYNDVAAWFYWTLGHGIFGLVAGLLIALWL